MKRRILSKALLLLMILSLSVSAALAQDAGDLVSASPGLTEAISSDGNLLKITTAADFAAGASENLLPDSAGNGALALAEGAASGTFYSAVYEVEQYDSLVASWNASLPDGASIEVKVRIYAEDGSGQGGWTDWMSYGVYGPAVYRGSTEDSDSHGYASIGVDTIDTKSGYTSRYIQMMAVLNAGGSGTPVLRQLAATTNSEATYAETPVVLPDSAANAAPAYSQLIRDPDIGGSICSPSTITVQLNSRDPSLDLLPEELALSVRDFNYGFGNWSYCVSAAGLYGYESYAQFADEDILMQELAQGRNVGISVKYSTSSTSSVYLEGAYGSTSGHLISLVGYYYEPGHEGDKDYLHFYSSDTYSAGDATSYHDYKWTQLSKCWSNRIAYIIPSLTAEEGAGVTGVTREEAELTPVDGSENVYALTVNGAKVDLTGFTTGKDSTFGHGVLAYTVEGFATDMEKDLVSSSCSIVYPNPMQVTANQTFYYKNIAPTADGYLSFDANAVLAGLGVPLGEAKTVTIYAMANNGVRYTASIECTRTAPAVIVDLIAGQSGWSAALSEDSGITTVSIAAADVAGAVKAGFLVPAGSDLSAVNYYCGTEPFAGTFSGAGISETVTDAEGNAYAVFSFDPAVSAYYLAIDWKDGAEQYYVDLSEVISSDSGIEVTGNLIFADLSSGILTGSAVRTGDGYITLTGSQGVYLSPVYSTDNWEYLMGTLSAVTPGGSSAELMIRAKTQTGGWSGWFSWGEFGSGVSSASQSSKDSYVNMDTDVFCIRGSSATANASQLQLKVVLKAGNEGSAPTLFGVSVTYKKDTYSASDAVYSGETAVEELPGSAFVDTAATSAYCYASGMASWRFENMMLMLLNAQGADLLFEEVALNGYDTNSGWGNWAYTIFKAGLFGYSAYTQYGATPTLIQQAIADGSAVGLYVHGGAIPTTNSSNNRQIVVYGYETDEEGEVIFHYICASGDDSELASGAVYNTCTAGELANAIETDGSDSVRGAMYVVGGKALESGVIRVPATAAAADSTHYVLSAGGNALSLPADFTSQYKVIGQGGVIAYTLASESDGVSALAQRTFYYDADLDENGNLVIPEALAEKLNGGDSATVYVICNSGVTYVAELKAYQEPAVVPPIAPVIPPVIDYPVIDAPAVEEPETPVKSYDDVASSAWYYDAVTYVTAQGWMEGVSETEFAPDMTVDRAMIVTVLWRLSGSPDSSYELPGVSDTAWYHDSAAWAAEQGILLGYGNGEFALTDAVTREQIVVFLYRWSQMAGKDVSARGDFTAFADGDAVSDWAKEAVSWAVAVGLLQGRDGGMLAPQAEATRAEMATLFCRFSAM